MRTPMIVLLLATIAGATQAAAAEQCLSPAQLHEVTRMASVMGIGAAVRRCGQCLGADLYAQTLSNMTPPGYARVCGSASGASAAEPRTAEYADSIVRQHARTYAETLSGHCDVCRKTADLVKSLSATDARDKFYAAEGASLAASSDVKLCP